MTDPRETKLPKWAQELIHEERAKSSLRWPAAPKPAPDFTIGVNPPDETWVYYVVGYDLYLEVQKKFHKSHGIYHKDSDCKGFGHRTRREDLFLSKSDAIRQMQWQTAEQAASALHRAYSKENEE